MVPRSQIEHHSHSTALGEDFTLRAFHHPKAAVVNRCGRFYSRTASRLLFWRHRRCGRSNPGAQGSDVHGTRMFCGHAVVRLGRRHRPGLLFRMTSANADAVLRTSVNRGRVADHSIPHFNPDSRKPVTRLSRTASPPSNGSGNRSIELRVLGRKLPDCRQADTPHSTRKSGIAGQRPRKARAAPAHRSVGPAASPLLLVP